MKAISIRQPWAWLIVRGFKDIENRSWWTKFRGPVLIHAGKTMTRADYQACQIFVAGFSALQLPEYGYLRGGFCGGIVGSAEITDCVSGSSSPWFTGEWGLMLSNRKACSFHPINGALGFFDVPDLAAICTS